MYSSTVLHMHGNQLQLSDMPEININKFSAFMTNNEAVILSRISIHTAKCVIITHMINSAASLN